MEIHTFRRPKIYLKFYFDDIRKVDIIFEWHTFSILYLLNLLQIVVAVLEEILKHTLLRPANQFFTVFVSYTYNQKYF